MPKIKRRCKWVFLLLMIFLLTGCWDKQELENKTYAIGIGLDPSEEEGKIKVTMLFANPEVGSMQGGGGSLEEPREIISFDAYDFITAKRTANSIISRSVSYDLLKIIVVSEEFAKDPKFITAIYDTLRDKQIRMDSYLAVSRQKASEYFVNNKPKMETRPHKYFQYMIEHGTRNGLVPDSTLFRFYKTTDSGSDLYLAMYTSAGKVKNAKIQGEDKFYAGELNATGELDDTQFIGSAVFKDGVMVGKLTGAETRFLNILDDTTDIEDIIENIPDPFSNKKDQMAIRIIKDEKNKIKMDLKREQPKIMITIPLKILVLSNPSMVDLAHSEKNQQLLKRHITENSSRIFEEFLKKTQTELKGAPFPLSLYARKYFRTVEEFNEYNWNKAYTKADIKVNFDIEISDYNAQKKKPKRRDE